MYRGTTPTVQLILLTDELDLSEVSGIWVTFRSPCVEMTFSRDEVEIDIDEGKAYISMTQEQTLSFGIGKIKVQARILMNDGAAYATDVADVEVEDILMEGVLEVEEDTAEDPGEPPEGGAEDPGEPPEGGAEDPDGDGAEGVPDRQI